MHSLLVFVGSELFMLTGSVCYSASYGGRGGGGGGGYSNGGGKLITRIFIDFLQNIY